MNYDWISYHRKRTPEKTAITELPSYRQVSYRAFDDRISRLHHHLTERGIERGDRVAFLIPNSIDILEIMFAVWRAGGICVALNTRLTAPELEFILQDSGAKLAFVGEDYIPIARQLKARISVESWIFTKGNGEPSDYESIFTFSDGQTRAVKQVDPNDACLLMYSSGTTGAPKGVIITHEMIHFANLNSIIPDQICSDSVSLVSMPLFHIAALVATATPFLFCGATLLVQRSFDPADVITQFSSTKGITHFLGVPRMYDALDQHSDIERADFSSLKVAAAGATKIPEILFDVWLKRGVKVREGYGLTETTGPVTMMPIDEIPRKIGSIGKPLMYVDIMILRSDGTEAATDEPGEIAVRGPVVSPGYWGQDSKNELNDQGRWFLSGDIGTKDAEGFLYIHDRVKDMFVSGGENVYPAEVENTISRLKCIDEVAVIGVPDAKWGEVGCAIVVLRPGQALTLHELQAHCSKSLAHYKIPKQLNISKVSLPRNATGKLQKFKLREQSSS